MGKTKGQSEYKKFEEGKPLTRKEAILAQCYICNGEEEGAEDCKGISCPLYDYFPYKGKKGMPDSKRDIPCVLGQMRQKPQEPRFCESNKKLRSGKDNRNLELESGSFMASQGKEIAGAGALVA